MVYPSGVGSAYQGCRGKKASVTVVAGSAVPVFVKEQHHTHCKHQNYGGCLTHLKRPRNVRQVVEDDVGERRIAVHVGDAVMNDHHDERGQHEHEEHVDVADKHSTLQCNAPACGISTKNILTVH